MTKAIIYARFSPRPDADETESNEKQIARCQEYCDAHGYEVVAVHEDLDASGGMDTDKLAPEVALRHRRGLLDALDALRNGWVLVVRWRSRIARDVFLEEWAHRRAESVGARIEATDEANGGDPDTTMMRQILSAFRQRERAIIRAMTRRGMRRHQAAGRRMSRADRCPFGWTVDPQNPDMMVHEPAEQETIEIIKELRGQGQGLRQIARWLEAHGIERRGKKNWPHNVVRNILTRAEIP
jgi:DNA invertase Pin-like site-specific DNA recombinase